MEIGMQSESIQGMRPRKGMRPICSGHDDSCQFACVDHSAKSLQTQGTPLKTALSTRTCRDHFHHRRRVMDIGKSRSVIGLQLAEPWPTGN
jgi:hypothetical protein